MNNSIIKKVTKALSIDIDLSISKEENIKELDFAIKELKKILKAEKTRKDITKKELLNKNNYYNDDLPRYLISIEKNIKVLDLYIEVLNNKKLMVLVENKL